MNGRTALGACFVLLAVLAGAIFLDRAQRLVPVYAAARDLPAGLPLQSGDLMVVRVRLPAAALRHYLQPSPSRAISGWVLAAPVRRETLVPAELVLASTRHADLVELPVQVDAGDMAQGLRPGDSVRVLAAYTEGARRGRAVVLLPTAEVVQLLQDPAGLTGTGEARGVQLRMPSDRAPVVAAAIATARIFVVKATGLAAAPAPPSPTSADADQEPPPDTSQPVAPPIDTGQPGTTAPSAGTDPGEVQPGGTQPEGTGSGGTGSGGIGLGGIGLGGSGRIGIGVSLIAWAALVRGLVGRLAGAQPGRLVERVAQGQACRLVERVAQGRACRLVERVAQGQPCRPVGLISWAGMENLVVAV
jgi:hypothetical protein